MTLRWRLTVAFVLVVLVPLLVGVALVSRALPDAVQARQQIGVTTSARLAAQVVRDHCDRAKSSAEAAGRATTMTGPGGVRTAIVSLVQRSLADGIRVLGPDGRVVATAGSVPSTPVDCGGQPVERASGTSLSAVVPLTTADGKPAGTAIASFDVSGQLMQRLREAAATGEIVLVSGSGDLVASTRPVERGVLRDALAPVSERPDSAPISFHVPAGVGLAFGVVVLEPAAGGPGLLRDAGLVVLIAVLLAIAIAVLSARTTTRPLEELSEAVARIAGGDLATRIEVRSKDEIGRLATAFNAMTGELRGYVGQLQASREKLQTGLSRLGDTLSSTHDLDRILDVVLESAIASTWATGGMVMLLSPDRSELVLASSQGVDVAPDLRLAVGGGVSGQVALSGDPVRGRVGHGPGELRPAPGEPSDTSLIAVPLKSSGTVIGVLDLYGSVHPEGFDDNDVATIRTFASQATVAVHNVMLHEEAQRLSLTDGLTGLWNYRYFTMTVNKEIERAARFNRPLAVLMLDLDHFKDVNDTFGHPRGDAVLIEMAARIKAQVRDVDTVARYGGEEFVVVLPETDEEGAGRLAERICSAVRRTPFGEPGVPPILLTISAGGAVFPVHGDNASALLAGADQALYQAKNSGRDRWQLYRAARAGTEPPLPRKSHD